MSWVKFPIKNYKRLSKLDLEQLTNSEVFYYFGKSRHKSSFERGYLRREWTRLSWMAINGKYHEANEMRANLLVEARTLHGISKNYTPSIMERAWTTHFGHLAPLLAFEDAQKFGLVPDNRRLVLSSNIFEKSRPLFRAFSNNFDFMDSPSKASIFDSEPFFPLTEKISFMTKRDGFLEITQFLDEMGKAYRRLGSGSKFDISFTENEILEFKKLLAKNGLSDQVPFIAIHIREAENKFSDRNSQPSSFWPAIKYLTEIGKNVVRVGYKSQTRFPRLPGFIDLTELTDGGDSLQDYAISNCEFFVTSQSGPASLAHIIGVPTLTVDALGIARVTYSTRALSMTLPKRLKNDSGETLSWESYFEHQISMRDIGFQIAGYKLSCNTSQEILNAVKEFESKMKMEYLSLSNPINFVKAKETVGGIGDGLVSEEFFS